MSTGELATVVPVYDTAEPVLALDAVTKRFGRVAAVDEVSVEVGRGEHVALVGPSGCGKSTTLRLVAGLEQPDSGRIRIDGAVMSAPGSSVPVERRRVGIVFQDHALFPHLTVGDNVGFGLAGVPGAQRRSRVGAVLDLVEMTRFARRYPHELSGGEQQRVALARALAPDPTVLLLDEAFSNLDRNLRAQIRAEVTAILTETATTAVFVTHDQAEALAVGQRIAVLRDGRVEQLDVPETVFHSPANRFVATFMGEADFLPAHLEREALRTEVGVVSAPAGLPGRGQPGSDGLEVMARPHEVDLDPEPDRDGVVESAEFQGAFVLYRVRLASGRTLRSLQPHTVTHRPGDPVGVRLVPGHVPTVLRGDHTVGRT